MSKGVLYIAWEGPRDPKPVLERSIASLNKFHPELKHHVHWLPSGSDLRDKSAMLNLTPYDETLYLDADTVLFDRIDYGFERASQHGMAICISTCPWARRYTGLKNEGDLVEYDTGVIFFDREHGDVRNVFGDWNDIAKTLDSSVKYQTKDGVKTMPCNDQASFASAVYRRSFNPHVLPVNYNCHPQWQETLWGPLKVWHHYEAPDEYIALWNEQQSEPEAIIACGRFDASTI